METEMEVAREVWQKYKRFTYLTNYVEQFLKQKTITTPPIRAPFPIQLFTFSD